MFESETEQQRAGCVINNLVVKHLLVCFNARPYLVLEFIFMYIEYTFHGEDEIECLCV